ncbi:DUF4625 domain-containing protein [Flammeovirga sp. SubArs3]|uniref:DUF4625 domain-containing protein n=1 Tax=Flammeovirga sp. SubArs3 TaxID=2995316 RepID=UPI00248C84FD|nr:DUF4625 domain-containing protein [Flammeovirga sp. SubArs3]
MKYQLISFVTIVLFLVTSCTNDEVINPSMQIYDISTTASETSSMKQINYNFNVDAEVGLSFIKVDIHPAYGHEHSFHDEVWSEIIIYDEFINTNDMNSGLKVKIEDSIEVPDYVNGEYHITISAVDLNGFEIFENEEIEI